MAGDIAVPFIPLKDGSQGGNSGARFGDPGANPQPVISHCTGALFLFNMHIVELEGLVNLCQLRQLVERATFSAFRPKWPSLG